MTLRELRTSIADDLEVELKDMPEHYGEMDRNECRIESESSGMDDLND